MLPPAGTGTDRTARDDRGPAVLLSMALGAALLCGLMQNVARVAARALFGQRLDHGVDAWWLTPLGDAVVAFALALLLVLVGLVFRRARATDFRLSVMLFPVVLTAVMLGPDITRAAQLILSAGIAIRAGTWLASRVNLDRHLPRVVGGLAAVTLLVAAPFGTWPAVREWLDTRGLRVANPGAPNVLVLLWDTARASSMSLYGHERETTPFLTRFARDGVVFDRAFGTASYTLPSHASLFTGRWAHELPVTWRVPLGPEPQTLAEAFKASGYRTGAFSANHIYVTREWGLGRGFAHFEEHRISWQAMIRSSSLLRAIVSHPRTRDALEFDDVLARVHASANHEKLLRWLERDRGRPYFAFVNFMEAHTPYQPSTPFARRFGWIPDSASSAGIRRLRRIGRMEPEEKPREEALHAQRAYEGAIAELDAEVGAMLDDLRARGLLDNTLVVITADHGEEFGEHGVFGHGNSLYYRSLHVPLVMVMPGKLPAGRRVGTAVSLRDIPATIADLATLGNTFPGASMRTLWEQPSTPWHVALSELRHEPDLIEASRARLGDLASAADDSAQVIRNPDGTWETFTIGANGLREIPGDSLSARAVRLRAALPPPRSDVTTASASKRSGSR